MLLTKKIKFQLLAFVVVAVAATYYLASRYVRVDPLGANYQVTAEMPDAGGSFKNGEVTFRGVSVGRIDSIEATRTGMRAKLTIESGAPEIPSDVSIAVANRSVIGEQYIDLREGTSSAEPLAAGDVLRAGDESQPPPLDEVLRSGADFVDSVPEDSLNTVIDETYELSRGASDNLGNLLRASKDFYKAADRNFLATQGLIENSDRVLTTQQNSADSIRAFSSDLSVIARTMRSSDGDLRQLLANSPAAAREVELLFAEVGQPLGVLLSNLVTPAQVFGVNANGVSDALVSAPRAVSIGWTITGSRGLNLGLSSTFFNPLPCTTGYGGTALRRGTDTAKGKPFNTAAGCRSSDRRSNVRGPKSVPSKLGAPVSATVRNADSLADLMGGTQ